ncbi:amino acid adenylation domain-containing protein [Spirillospora sp. CA-294931]|uniref:amino acid adenylation domain-containing protein n=1 Tax=Spirillospora sp. CA-294931 TaxID=3240042 RepID=UPI003D919724
MSSAAERIRRARARLGRADHDADRIERAPATVASYAQERMWVLDHLHRGRTNRVSRLIVRLRGTLDHRALRRSFAFLVERHEVLRTVFEEHDGTPRPVVLEGAPFAFEVVELGSRGTPAEREEEAAATARAAVLRPIDLARGPILRVLLVRTAPDEHVLAIGIHHIATDGWSMRVLSEELGEAYTAFVKGRAPDLAPLPVRYRDFAWWQRGRLDEERMAPLLDYWRETLAGATPTELEGDRPRPRVLSGQGDSIKVDLSPELTAAIERTAQEQRATVFMVLLAAFQAVLRRHTGRDDIVVGTPTAGRTRPEVENLVGFFINALVLRTDLSGDPTFAELLTRVRGTTLGAYAHQELPFEDLLAEFQIERDLSRDPLFQIELALNDDEISDLHMDGIAVEHVPSDIGPAGLDLRVEFTRSRRGLSAQAQFATDLFERETIAGLLDHYVRLLERASADPGLRLSELARADRAERPAPDAEDQGPAVDRCLHELVVEQARRSPEAVAVTADGRTLSYAELDRLSAGLAASLRRQGVGPDVPVGVWMERSAEVVVALLGIARAGGAYVPIDPDVPEARVNALMDAVGARVLLCQPGWGARPTLAATGVVEVDEAFLRRCAEAEATAPEAGTTPKNLVSIYYTSGTTGAPKGVASSHEGWVNRMRWMQDRYGLRPGERVLHKTVLSFDDSAVEVFWPLMAGGQVVVLAPGLHRDPRAILRAAKARRVAVLQFVPSMLGLFLDEIGPEDRAALADLRVVVSSGEPLRPDLVKRFHERLGTGCGLHNQWGATEVSIDSTEYRCVPEDGDAPSVPVGRALLNNQVFVLDQDLEPADVGVPGDLYLSGIGLARGYWADPARTAEAFVPSPFGTGDRLYRTGDRGVRRADGQLLCLGRSDDQVKIRGIRIEPGEIEHVLRGHPAVSDALVVKWEPAPGDVRLAAYVVPSAAAVPGGDDLTGFLSARFPAYMVPAAFVPIEAVPRTPSGKADRKRLPAPEPRPAEPRTAGGAGNDTEALIAMIWADVLGRPDLDVNDNFFKIGGHSLLATKVIARLRRVLDPEIPLSLLFENPTIRRMAAALSDTGDEAASGIRPRPGETAPLSFTQEQLWFIDQVSPGRSEYNLPEVVRLRGHLDRAALTDALALIVERHQVLRSHIRMEGEAARLAPLPAEAFATDFTDLSDLGPEAAPERALALADELVTAPFDLSLGPFIRAHLIRIAADDHVLAIVIHHIATDAWSIGLLWKELSAAYAALRAGGRPDLEPLAVQYRDFAWWQREWLTDQRLEPMLAYWRERLAGATATELSSGGPRPPEVSGHGERIDFTLPDELSGDLRRLAEDNGVTLYVVLLAAFDVLLRRYSGSRDIMLGSVVAGRGRPEIESLIGFFAHPLVLRADLSGDPAVTELLDRVRTTVLGAFSHQEVPFERIVRELRPEREVGRNPLFQLFFTMRDEGMRADADAALDLPGVEVELLPVGKSSVRFDLELSMSDRGDAIDGALSYVVELFDPDVAAAMADAYRHVLQQFVDDPGRHLSELSIVTGAERRRLVHELNDTGKPLPDGELCLHELIEAQARRRPDAAAVVFGDRTLDYRELNAEADRLAGHLRSLGFGPERVAAVMMGRSEHLVVALLAVLKAGGAYVPIDTRHPSERVAFMLDDSGASCVLTDRAWAGRLPAGADVPTVVVDRDGAAWRDADASAPAPRAVPDNLAVCIFTSGSTGRPKAVMVPHRGLVSTAADLVGRCRIGPGDVVGAAMTIAFDVAVAELLIPLTCGATVAVVDDDACRDAQALARIAERHPFTLMWATPATWRVLVDAGWAGGELRALTIGEALVPELAARLGERVPELWNMYGPAETSLYSTAQRVLPGAVDTPTVPIGRPIDNERVHVLDEDLQLTPPGVVGELFIGGAGLTRGYAGRPGLTAERFVPDPFRHGERLYRTGDLVRQGTDGTLVYLGRNDHQVKIHGQRIELEEIEARLVEHPEVSAAVASAWRDAHGHARLVAHVAAPETAPDDLRDHLRRSLPDYMVPARFVILDALPLNGNGKVDRAALPEPGSQDPGLPGTDEPPRTDTERVLAGIWSRYLGLDEVGIRRSFFSLGGDSILSIHAANAARKAGLAITPRLMYEKPNIAELAAAIDAAAEPVDVPAEREAPTGPVPLGPIQHAFVRLVGPHDHYNQAARLRWHEPPDAPALAEALRALVAHHDALRSRLRQTSDGTWRQHIAETEPAELLQVVDVRDLDGAERTAALDDAAGMAHHDLDLRDGPIVRAVLVRGGDGHPDELILSVHHLAVDAASWPVLLDDLATAYGQFAAGDPVALPAKTTSYRAWADRLTRFAASEDLGAPYWRTMPSAPVPLPVDHDLGANTHGSAVTVTRALGTADTDAFLRAATDGESATEALVTALARALAVRAELPAVHLDLERHGREPLFDDVDLGRTVGWFTSRQPLLLELDAPADLDRCLTVVREHLRADPHHGIGYGIARYLHPRPPEHPAAPVRLAYRGPRQGEGDRPFTVLPTVPGALRHPELERAHLLDLDASVLDGRLHLEWRYSAKRHRRQTVEGIADSFVTFLLEAIDRSRHAVPSASGSRPFDRLFPRTPALRLRQHRHGVPGVSVALVADGEVTAVWGEGPAVPAAGTPVRPDTIFQAGSVSKHVAAVAALRLAADGVLDLDEDVERHLRRWTPPEGDRHGPLTVRSLLSHTSGLAATTLSGYPRGGPLPGIAETANGQGPATNLPVRADAPAGTVHRYSNGNYVLLQLVLEDLTGRPFADLVRELVFEPLDLVDSGYGPAFTAPRERRIAVGHDRSDALIEGSWRVYPELACFGLWTTAVDLARLAGDLQRALDGTGSVVLDHAHATELLTTTGTSPAYGLGTVVRPMAGDTWFGHIGNAAGYHCFTATGVKSAQGLVLLANSDRGIDLVADLLAELGLDDVPVVPAAVETDRTRRTTHEPL